VPLAGVVTLWLFKFRYEMKANLELKTKKEFDRMLVNQEVELRGLPLQTLRFIYKHDLDCTCLWEKPI
jgi:hypothetical protein